MMWMLTLSVVKPWGERIARGQKTIEVRSWRPDRWPIDRLLIVENDRRLTEPGDEDPTGRAVAVIRVADVRPWEHADAEAACSTWEPGWWAWVLMDVSPLSPPVPVVAKRKLYWTDLA